jgi:hypothetical protein
MNEIVKTLQGMLADCRAIHCDPSSETRNRLVDEIRAIHAGAASRQWTPEETTRFETLEAQVQDIDTRLDAIEGASPATPRSLPASRQRALWSFAGADDSAVLRSWLLIGSQMEQRGDADTLMKAGHLAKGQRP